MTGLREMRIKEVAVMEKIEKDGKVAVLYTPCNGGWSTRNRDYGDNREEILCMDARIVSLVIDGDTAGAEAVAKAIFPDAQVFASEYLAVAWVEKGKQFYIENFDGHGEDVHVIGDRQYMTA